MMPGIHAAQAARRRRLPLITSPRGSLSRAALSVGSRIKPLFWHLLQRRALDRCVAFHATSNAEAGDIRASGFVQPIAVIPNGIDLPNVPRSLRADRRTLLYLGRIHPIKGLPMLLQAWRELSPEAPDWTLRIVGPGKPEHLGELETVIRQLRLSRVEVAEPAYGPAKWLEYCSSDLFVLPSLSENFGMTVAESLACGTPVIATHATPWSGLETAKAGWWCPTETGAVLAALREATRASRPELEEMGERGRSWMQNEFGWSAIAGRMVETYEWILAGTHARPSWVI
jgi:glycosyltransferase involved in cell wall biosynthesis